MNMKWVLPIACVVTLAACQSGGMGRSNSSMGSSGNAATTTSGTAATGSSMDAGKSSYGTNSSGSSMGTSPGMTSSDKANPNVNPASGYSEPGTGQAKERGTNPALNTGPTTSGTTTK